MHFVVINPVGVIGGAERVLLACVDSVRQNFPAARISAVLFAGGVLEGELRKRGADCHVLPLPASLAKSGDTRLRKAGKMAGAFSLLWSLATKSPAGLLFIRRLSRLLRELSPTLIHSNGLKSHICSAFARPAGVSLLWHIHDYYSHRPLMAKVLRRIGSKVSGGIAISRSVGRDAALLFPRFPIHTVANCVDTDHFLPTGHPDDLDAIAGFSDKPSPGTRVGLVATYANWKGHDLFLDALAMVAPQFPGLRGYIVGGPIYTTAGSQFTQDELSTRARANGLEDRMGFVPFQADPAGVYRGLDVVVHASTRAEPFGLTIAEAMSCGRAVVVANAGGAAELFTDGVDALGFEPGNAGDLAEKIAILAKDSALRNQLGTTARESALDRFSLSRFSRELADVYRLHLTPLPGSNQ